MPLPKLIAFALPAAAVAALALAAFHPLDASAADAGSGSPSFRLVDSGATGPELNVGVTSKGHLFVGGWNGIARSTDDGETWSRITVQHVPGVGFAADRVLVVDPATDRVLVSDTYLGCTFLSWSDDDGASWSRNPIACGPGATDHQKVAVGKRTALEDPTGALYPNVVYVCANGLSHGNCGVSADGGLTFLPTAPHAVLCSFQGVPVADAEGVLYEPQTACGAKVHKTADNGRSWSTHPVPASPSRDAPDLAVTPDGTLYFFFTDSAWRPAFARSGDGGLSWDGPFGLPVAGLVSSAFPSVVAGDDGRVAFAFYATTDDAPGWSGNPGDAPPSVRWHGFVAVVTDAASDAPSVEAVRVTPEEDPLQYGCLSKLGRCLGNIADYMDVAVGPDGRVHAVFVDGCLAGCASAAASNADAGLVAVQVGGPRLRG